ncbi:30S ribosomal protein S3ae [Candidatus Bathyarchaeota archaeon]|nr:30S ribosomal protein S3ae [Candidatus Bathyarchaeota archaeon]NIU81289.1 30S ribosomal protein S3ae [Candidatus Bathyarchaeota archaeon]NIV67924.1 30S ribosomal protein S3ae [Candidatus Bathyarchaeota archaeon]NIW16365.1 30S ribosomal protein S3ae [Candidatus Bathyarchaeota archaeon]
MSSRRRGRIRDKWRAKRWYTVKSPPYFGGVELGTVPSDDPSKLVGRVIDATLYDVTDDFSHQYLKMHFRITDVEGKTAHTIFSRHEYSRDYLRSLVRRRTTRIDGIFNITTKDGYRIRLAVCALTLNRVKTSQEKSIRGIMKRIVAEKARILEFTQFVQEMVLGKLASDIYNEAKKITPLRHVGVRKSKLIQQPKIAA